MVCLALHPRADLFQPGRQADVKEPGHVTGGLVHVLVQVLIHDPHGLDRMGVEPCTSTALIGFVMAGFLYDTLRIGPSASGRRCSILPAAPIPARPLAAPDARAQQAACAADSRRRPAQ